VSDWKFCFLMANMFAAVHGNAYVSLLLCGFWTTVGAVRFYQEHKED